MTSSTIPHLRTATNKLEYALEKKLVFEQVAIEAWFKRQWSSHPPLATSSVDLRHCGYKLSPIDTNIFPAGFHNLSEHGKELAVWAASQTFDDIHSNCKNITLIPESHTRNPSYFESMATLKSILNRAGFEVTIGSLLALEKPLSIPTQNETLTIFPIHRHQDEIYVNQQRSCLIVLNHDLSDGMPDVLQGIDQPVVPSPTMGWTHRSKHHHFVCLDTLVQSFAREFKIDPWQIMPYHEPVRELDFSQKEISESLVNAVDSVLKKTRDKYLEYEIKDTPYAVIKSDQGTYGMSVMMVQSTDELVSMNRKQRNKMSTNKGGNQVSSVIVQEGVHTSETIRSHPCEPVVYMIGKHVIGGFYRIHKAKSATDNLNSPGMHFEPLPFETCCHTPDQRLSPHEPENQFYAFSVIARLGHLATLREFQP